MANTLAYGFVSLEHLQSERVNQVGVDRIFTAVQESAAEHNRVVSGALAEFVERTVKAQMQFELPAGGTLQPLDEHGNPLLTRPGGSYQVAFPIQGGGTAWGGNRVTNALMTVSEANRHTVDAQQKDADWIRRHMIAALVDDTTWTYNDKIGPDGAAGLGDITIQPLANGDTVTYLRVGGTSSTDDHYLAQAAAIADGANPFPTIYDELWEHPSNQGGPIVCYIASSLKTTTEALTDFEPVTDPDITPGNANDVLTGSMPRGFGDRVLGKTSNMWIVEWSALPAGYILAHATGAGPVLAMREYPAPELQGFFAEQHSPDGNRIESRMIRYAGFGCLNRIGAVVYQIGNATYQIPSGYSTPLPV